MRDEKLREILDDMKRIHDRRAAMRDGIILMVMSFSGLGLILIALDQWFKQ